MKRHLFFISVLILTLASCEEEPPGINYKLPTSTFDTTFILDEIPNAQVKEVLLEDVTGVSCVNCPEAALIAKGIVTANPGRVNVVALYNTISGPLGNPVNHPPVVSAFDFRSLLASEICQMVAIPGSIPIGYINRKKFPGKLDPIVPRDEWVSSVNAELLESTPVNISASASYNESTKELTTDVAIIYTASVSGDNFISVSILEDSIIDAQESKDGIGGVVFIPNYEHRHVMRDMYTASVGDLLNTTTQITLTPGRVIKRRYVKKIEKLVPYSHFKVVAFVHQDPTSKYVYQSQEAEVH